MKGLHLSSSLIDLSFEKHVTLYMCMFAWCLAIYVSGYLASCLYICLFESRLAGWSLFVYESASVYVYIHLVGCVCVVGYCMMDLSVYVRVFCSWERTARLA